MTETKKRAATRMVPAPSHGIIPERDFHERPVLEATWASISAACMPSRIST